LAPRGSFYFRLGAHNLRWARRVKRFGNAGVVAAIAAGCTLGVNSLVHYGVKMGNGAQLAAGAFLMKGEEVPPHTRWGGNPASQVQNDDFAEAVVVAVKQFSATNAVAVGS
jgi:acetyltransferase-like isoleucine patch superfamily enzyme